MIITRTPCRVSLLGGGTDYPSWCEHYGGLVLGGAVNKYAYHHVRHLPPFHGHKTRVVYSKLEAVKDNSQIEHRAVKAVLEHLGMGGPEGPGLEIFHASDLPGRSGTGSSSAFVVGLLNALSSLSGKRLLPHELAEAAIDVEQIALGETVGCQDQVFAAHGGLNTLRFHRGGSVTVIPLPLSAQKIRELEEHLLLFFTGETRTSSEVARSYAPALLERGKEQWAMMNLAERGVRAVEDGDYERLGGLIDQSWRIKCGLSSAVNTERASLLYQVARVCGAWGGKLTGAGGGGCMLLVVRPEKRKNVLEAMTKNGAVHVPFRFEFDGSVVVFADRERGAA